MIFLGLLNENNMIPNQRLITHAKDSKSSAKGGGRLTSLQNQLVFTFPTVHVRFVVHYFPVIIMLSETAVAVCCCGTMSCCRTFLHEMPANRFGRSFRSD